MIVVGVDGSPASLDALRFALEEAVRRDTGVRAVFAWTRPARAPRGFIPPELLDPEFLSTAAWRRLQDAVDRTTPGDDAPPIELAPVDGAADAVLLREAEGADLLVVGGPSRGAFGEAVHGSVVRACVRHATCPVVVVPACARVPVAA